MDKKQLQSGLCLLLAAAIWGFAFVAQRVGSQYIGTFAFNGIRFALGALSLLPVIAIRREPADRQTNLRTLRAGVICGLVLFAAATLQQMGLVGTAAGKSAFITGLYIVLVPILSVFLKRAISLNAWLGAGCSLAGLYLLCVTSRLTISGYDLLVFGCSIFFAVHILVIDHYSTRVPILKLAFCQFAICSAISLTLSALLESSTWPAIWPSVSAAALPILYSGFASVGVAYTLQILGQKNAKPTSAAIILSAETLFAMLGGYLILSERLTQRGILGAVLMMAGIVLTQLPASRYSLSKSSGETGQPR